MQFFVRQIKLNFSQCMGILLQDWISETGFAERFVRELILSLKVFVSLEYGSGRTISGSKSISDFPSKAVTKYYWAKFDI